MRKTTISFIITLMAGMLIFSCVQPLEPGVRTEATGLNQLNLTVSCQAPTTKADPFANYPNGVTELNENKIDHIDWFIFRDTMPNSLPWKSERVTFSDKADGTTEFPVVRSLDMDQYKALYDDGKGYVLTVANYPAKDLEGISFSAIRLKEIVSKELGDLANGVFTPLGSFVMTSYATPFELKEDVPVTVNAKLHRLAAKLSLNINVVPYIDELKAIVNGLDTTRLEYVQTWYPEVEGIRIYMTYANKHTTLTPNDTSMRNAELYDDDHFFTYNSRGFQLDKPVPTTADGTSIVTGTPFYSYPMKWETSDSHAPFFKIILKWTGYVEAHHTVENGGRYINHTEGRIRRGDTVIVDKHDKSGTLKTSSESFYYKIVIPSNHNILHSNVWTKINLDVAVLGGVDEEQTVDVIGRYYVVDWSDPRIKAGGELTAGKYLNLSTSRNTFYIYGGNSIQIPVKSSHNLNASIVKREAWINGDWTENPKTVTVDGTTYEQPDNLQDRGTVAADGRSSITFTDNLNTTMDYTMDCYPMRFTINIQHAPGTGGLTEPKTVYVIQYPSIYIDFKPGGNAFVDGYYGNVDGKFLYRSNGSYHGTGWNTDRNWPMRANPYLNGTIYSGNSEDNTSGHVPVPYGRITRYADTQKDMTLISISSFSQDSKKYKIYDTNYENEVEREYIIADPRQVSGYGANSLIQYYDGTGNHDWEDNASKIMIGSKTTPNLIAPKFMMSSRWGRLQNSDEDERTYENMEKRCATYQEAGYPAGRWRLPTEAEVNFVLNLQRLHFIETLFSGDGWASNETALHYSSSRNMVRYTSAGTTVRCVYDVWYWGEDPVDGAYSTYMVKPE